MMAPPKPLGAPTPRTRYETAVSAPHRPSAARKRPSDCPNYITDYLRRVEAGAVYHAPALGGVPSANYKIENVVASTSLGKELDLQAIALVLGGAEYEPEQFPRLIYRLKEPKTAILLFRRAKVVVLLFGSGKLVCTGARTPADVEKAVEKITAELKAAGLLH